MSRYTPLRAARLAAGLALAAIPAIDALLVLLGLLARSAITYRVRARLYEHRLRSALGRAHIPEGLAEELTLMYRHALRCLDPLVVLGVAGREDCRD